MKIRSLHSWTLTPKAAVALQRRLVGRVITRNRLGPVRFVAGADISTSRDSPCGYAGVVVMSYPDLQIVETVAAAAALTFPYIPGLLAFRELPLLLKAFARLKCAPDLILVDGQTYFLKAGDPVTGTWMVGEIKDNSVVLRSGDHVRELQIEGGSQT